jgi:flagellar M-ring protein FliF
MNENITHFWEKVKEVYHRMEFRQRLMIAILLAITFGVIIWLIAWSMRTEYGLLYGGLSPEDAQRTTNYLRERGIPYRLRDEGRRIDIPEGRIYETRINMIANEVNIGVKHSGVGFEIFDRTSLGVTEFVQRNVHYVRAKQGELERTIMAITGVELARVHLQFPPERLFRDDQRDPSASVMLKLTRRLDQRNIDGIINIIASSEGIDVNRITLTDQNGFILSNNAEDPIVGLSNFQLNIQNTRESSLAMSAQSMLDQTLGSGNSVVRVTAELNWDHVERRSRTFIPEGQVVLSEEIQTASLTNLSDSLATINEHIITNYEISTTDEHRIAATGDIRRLSVAALINFKRTRRTEDGREIIEYVGHTEQEMASIEAVIRSAVGYNAERGDQIAVTNFYFDRSDMEDVRLEHERHERIKQYVAWAEKGAVLILLLVLVLILTSQFKKLFQIPEPEEDEELEEAEDEGMGPAFTETGGPEEEGFYPEGEEGMPMGEGKISFTFKPMKDIEIEQTEAMLLQETIQKFVIENPEVTVKLIKSWLMDEKPPQKGRPSS